MYYSYQQHQHEQGRLKEQDYAYNMGRAEKAQKINRMVAVRLTERQEALLLHGTRRDRRLGGKRRLRRFIKRSVTGEVYGLKKPHTPRAQTFVEIGGANNHVADKKPRKRVAPKKPAKAQAR